MAEFFLKSCKLLVVFLVLNTYINAGLCQSKGDEAAKGRGRALVPAMFVFGDSLVDNGNNNFLPSLARANYFPYGIDFNGGPTGRFSNGYTVVDTIAESLGLPLLPSHADPFGYLLRNGVNYASAAAGILDNTGGNYASRIPFSQQISNFNNTLHQLRAIPLLDMGMTPQELAKSIFFVGMGSNDYLNNYLLAKYDTKKHYNGQQYADFLVNQYSQQLTRLYNLGARKFVIAGVGPMGCLPGILAHRQSVRCFEAVNRLIVPFNTNTKAMIKNFTSNLPGFRYSYIDAYKMFQDLLDNPKKYGFSVLNRACCGIGKNRGELACLPFQIPCLNRNQYIFWDAFHPTAAVNILFGKKAFNGDTDVVYPVNIEKLARL